MPNEAVVYIDVPTAPITRKTSDRAKNVILGGDMFSKLHGS